MTEQELQIFKPLSAKIGPKAFSIGRRELSERGARAAEAQRLAKRLIAKSGHGRGKQK